MKKIVFTGASLALTACVLFSCASTGGASGALADQNAVTAPAEEPAADKAQATDSTEAVSAAPETQTQETAANEQVPLAETAQPETAQQPAQAEAAEPQKETVDETMLEAVPAEEAVIIEPIDEEPVEAPEQWVVTDEPLVMDEVASDPAEKESAAEEVTQEAASGELAETNTESGVVDQAAAPATEPAAETTAAAPVTETAAAEQAQANRESTLIEGPADNVQVTERQPFAASGTQVAAQTVAATETKLPNPQTPPAPLVQEGTEQTAAATEDTTDPAAEIQKAIPVPSRSITLKKNQYLDIVYPGSGWVYLGETDGTKLFTYFGRKLGTSDTTFTLRSRASGETMLHFYKTDALTGNYIDDYLAVTIENKSATTNEHVKAPDYAEVVPPKPARKTAAAQKSATPAPRESTEILAPKVADGAAEETEAEEVTVDADADEPTTASALPAADERSGKTVVQTTGTASSSPQTPVLSSSIAPEKESQVQTEHASVALSENLPAGTALLDEAKAAYKAKEFEKALAYVQAYLESGDSHFDEALYLQGQVLEADSTVKNIRSAIDSYETLTKRYPASKLWKDANKRAIYLKRFYIDIR